MVDSDKERHQVDGMRLHLHLPRNEELAGLVNGGPIVAMRDSGITFGSAAWEIIDRRV